MIRRRLELPLLFAAMGAFALASQTLLFREFLVGFGGNELGIAFFFGTWLFWIAVGAFGATVVAPRIRTSRFFLPLTCLYPVSFALQLVLFTELRPLAGVEPFELFPLGALLLATLLANAPLSLLTGFLFQAGCSLAAETRGGPPPGPGPSNDTRPATRGPADAKESGPVAGQVAARLYAFEALGSFGGGLFVTALLWRRVTPPTIFTVVAVGLLVVLALAALSRRARVTAAVAGLLVVSVLLARLTPLGDALAARLTALRWETVFPAAELLETHETPYQRVSVATLSGQRVLLANGDIVASTSDDPDHAANAAMLLAQNPRARRALVIGLGSEGLIPHLLHYPLERVDVVEVDEDAHRIALRHLGDPVRRAFEDARVSATFTDPRDFLVEHRGRGRPAYDLVLVDLPDPDTAYLNRFFTVDFYRSVREVLADGGILATRITAGENYAGTELVRYGRSVFRSLREVFEEVEVTPGEHAWLFASRATGLVSLDPAVLERRFRELREREEAVPPEVFATLIPVDRVPTTRKLFEQTGNEAPSSFVNTDERPVTLFYNLLVSSARSGSALVEPLEALRLGGLRVLVLPLLALLLLRLFYRATTRTEHRAAALNGTALLTSFGAVSMCLSIVLFISFQNRFGYVFLSIGLLCALFMLGLFIGGLGGSRLVRSVEGFRFWPAHAVCAPAIGLCLLLPRVLDGLATAPTVLALPVYHSLFLLTGAACGTAFPAAGYYLERAGAGAGRVAGVLESADHWGGALGAGFIGIFVVPVLGVSGACLLLALGLACTWVLFLAEQAGGSPVVSRLRWLGGARDWAERARRRHGAERRRAAAFVLTGVVLSVVLVGNLLVAELSAPRVRLDEQWIETRFDAPRVETRDMPFVHHVTLEKRGGDVREVLVASRAIAPDAEGYGGPINLLVVVGREGEIEEVSLIESEETPAYIHGIDRWLSEFRGRTVDEPIRLGERGVDVMTGATVTSRAIERILDVSRHRIARDVLHRPAVAAVRPSPIHWTEPEAIYVVLALLLAVPIFLWGGTALRTLFLALNLVLAGLLLNLQLSMTHVVRLLSGWLPSPHSPGLLLLVGGVLLLAVAFGPLYCGYLCPFGAAQELLGRLGLVREPTPTSDRRARRVKYVVLALVLVAYGATRSENVLAFDPLQWAFGLRYETAAAVLLALIAVLSLFHFRFWCRYLCPVGALLSLFTRVGLALRWSRQKVYAKCDLGVGSSRELDCLQCNRCIARQALPSELTELAEEALETASAVGRRRRDWLLGLGLASALLVGVLAVRGGAPSGAGETDPLAGVRDVDVELVRRRIQENRLSDHEALFYRPLDEIEEAEEPAPAVRIPVH